MEALPDMPPHWCKGRAAVLAMHAIVSTSIIKVNQMAHYSGAILALLTEA